MLTNQLRAETLAQTQDNLIDHFNAIDDWMDRYKLIIDLGRELPEYAEDWKTDDFKITGCQSQVWIKPEVAGDRLKLHAISDAAIVSGLIAILLLIYHDRTADEILGVKPDFIDALGLKDHLSPTRSNGLFSMMKSILNYAFALQSAKG